MKEGRSAGVPAGTCRKKTAGEDAGAPNEWYSRGYLPHRDTTGLLQSITFRLADSLPQKKLIALEDELTRLPEKERTQERRIRIEQWLDAGMGCCALKHPMVAQFVENALLHFDGQRYALLAWCIMPNHIHALVEPKVKLTSIVHGWKSYTARWALAQNENYPSAFRITSIFGCGNIGIASYAMRSIIAV